MSIPMTPWWFERARTGRSSVDADSVRLDLDRKPDLEAVVTRETRHADGGPATEPRLLAEHVAEQVRRAAGDLVDVVELGKADDEAQRPDDRPDVVEGTDRVADAGQRVHSRQPRSLVPLLDRHLRPKAPRVQNATTLELRHVTREKEQRADLMVRLHAPVARAVVRSRRVVGHLETEFANTRFGVHRASSSNRRRIGGTLVSPT